MADNMIVDKKGYFRRRRDGKPLHRIIAEAMNGGKLRKGAVVHHKNRNKLDNSPWNLRIFKSQKAHNFSHLWTAFWFGKRFSYKGGKREIGPGLVLFALGGIIFLTNQAQKKKSVPNIDDNEQLNDHPDENISA